MKNSCAEGSNPATDLPCDATPIHAEAGVTKQADITFNGYKQGVDGPSPDGRPADDFSNSDRGLAENLAIPFHEPTDYFGWRAWETYNIHGLDDLEGLLDAMAKEAKDLEQSEQDWQRHDMLVQEIADIRRINDLED